MSQNNKETKIMPNISKAGRNPASWVRYLTLQAFYSTTTHRQNILTHEEYSDFV